MKPDIVPLIHFLGQPEDVNQTAMVIRWLYHYRVNLLKDSPMLACLINDRYTMPFLRVNYANMELETALNQFIEAQPLIQKEINRVIHLIVDLMVIYYGEGPFTSSSWNVRVTDYIKSLAQEK